MMRRGFTLVEVMVALVITSLIATLAFGAAQTGIDVRARLARAQHEEAGALAVRTMLHDALRHAELGSSGDDTTFALGGTDALRFVTRGVRPPLGAGGRWAMSVTMERNGLVLRATPIDGTPGAPLRVTAATVRAIDVRVLDRGVWSARWPRVDAPPSAIAVRLLDANGRDVVPALVARTRPEGIAEDAP